MSKIVRSCYSNLFFISLLISARSLLNSATVSFLILSIFTLCLFNSVWSYCTSSDYISLRSCCSYKIVSSIFLASAAKFSKIIFSFYTLWLRSSFKSLVFYMIWSSIGASASSKSLILSDRSVAHISSKVYILSYPLLISSF